MKTIRKTPQDGRPDISAAGKAMALRRSGLSVFQVSRVLRTNPIQVAHWIGEVNTSGANYE